MAPFRSSASSSAAAVYCAPPPTPFAPVVAPAVLATTITSATNVNVTASSAAMLFATPPAHTNSVWSSDRLPRQPAALAFCYPHHQHRHQRQQLVLLDRYRQFHAKHHDELSRDAHVASTSAWLAEHMATPAATSSALPLLLLSSASASSGNGDVVDESAAHPEAQAQAQEPQQQSAHAALHVLATRELLEHITDFARGVPGLLTTFVHMSNSTDTIARSSSVARPLSPFVDPPRRNSSSSSSSDIDRNGDDEALDGEAPDDERDQDTGHDGDDDCWDACYDPQASNGLVARLAVERNSRRVLRMLLRLHAFPVYRRKRKLRLEMAVLWCVELGRLELLEWLVPRLPASVRASTAAAPAALLDAAVQNGDVAMLQWLARHGFAEMASHHVSLAALQQTPLARVCAVFEWFYAALGDASFVTEALVTELAHRGCLDALAFVHRITSITTTRTVFSHAAMDAAAREGHLDVVAFLHKHRREGCSTAALDDAAANGHLDVVRFLHCHRHEGGTAKAMDVAAANGHLRVVQFLHAHRAEGSTVAAMNRAARNGHLAVVQFLYEQRRECGTFAALDGAALGGHLDVVTYLHCVRGGGDGNADGNGVCTALAMDNAASAGHLTIVQFLHAHRREGCTTKAMDLAAHNGHLDVVQFLHAHRREGCTRAAMNLAASAGHLDVVTFLHEHRREGCTKRALSMAARNGFTPVVRFLLEHRTEGCGEDALRAAYRSGRFEVARYLHSRGFMGDVAKCVVSCCCSTVVQYSS